MKTQLSQKVAAGHFLAGERPIARIKVDGKVVDHARALEALETIAAQSEKYRHIDDGPGDPGRITRARHILEARIAQPLKSMATATIATVGASLGRIRDRIGDQAVDGAIHGAAVGRSATHPSAVRRWLEGAKDRTNFLRLVGLEVLASYHPDKVADTHKVEIEFVDGETVTSNVEVLDHRASFMMNRYVATVSGASLVPPGFPTGLGTFGVTAVVMAVGSFIASATGRHGLASSMRRVAGESAALAPIALTSLAADAVYVGASAVHLAMHKTVKETPIVRVLSDDDVQRNQATFKERVGDAKKRARRQMELTKKAKILAKKDPKMLELLHRIATKEAQRQVEDAIKLHERAEKAEAAGFHLAADRLEHDAEHAAEKAVDARRVEILSEEAMLREAGQGTKKGSAIGRIVDAERHQVVPDTDHEPIDESEAARVLERITTNKEGK